MPPLFPTPSAFLLCALIVAGAQAIYATVGFGGGMFAIALLAIVLPDLAGAVTTLFILNLASEIWILLHCWRQGKLRLLLGLIPTMAVGMWLGTKLLISGDVEWLKRALGVVVVLAGGWFLYEDRQAARQRDISANAKNENDPHQPAGMLRWSVPAGLAAGVLAGLFGTGGPPVIFYLKKFRLDKHAFRATLIWFFSIVSIIRAASYFQAGLLSTDKAVAALWLIVPSLAGTFVGMWVHRRLSNYHFATAVSVLLILLGTLLLYSGWR